MNSVVEGLRESRSEVIQDNVSMYMRLKAELLQ